MDLNIDISLNQGSFTLKVKTFIKDRVIGIYGPSGAGKSTLLHLISGLKKPCSGKIIMAGNVLCDINHNIFLAPEKRNIGVVFQDNRLFPHLNVYNNIMFGSKKQLSKDFKEAVIETLNITYLLKRAVTNLSGGEQKRVAIARALLSEPKLLLLDEPFSGIDAKFKQALIPFIERIRRSFDIPMIIISHDLSDILSITESIIILDKGCLVDYGKAKELAFSKKCREIIKPSRIYSTFDARVNLIDKKNGIISFCTITTEQMIKAPYKEGIKRDTLIRARIRPQDIILAKEPTDCLSSQNQIKAKILKIKEYDNEVLIELDAGFRILSSITRKAAFNFDIKENKDIWILFKSLAVDFYVP